MQVLDASDGDLAPYTLHPHDDVQESEVGENEKDGDGGETSVCRGCGRCVWGVDNACSDGGRSSGCRDTGVGEGMLMMGVAVMATKMIAVMGIAVIGANVMVAVMATK